VLFSEPKIPQVIFAKRASATLRRFSALQRAENSSTTIINNARNTAARFSALQRAENSSINS